MEFYPMPLFVKMFVSNMEISLRWYKDVLNFQSVFELPDKNGETTMAHIRGKKYQDIMLLSKQSDCETNREGVILNLAVDDIDKFAIRAAKAGAEVKEGPVDRPWNARELVLKDPDGYVITLSMMIDKGKAFDDVIDGVR
ncbi:VOC family protein [Metabacillus fastidiosus]|uniref:VOC family protein n=1 Tax=Metabacillus fastidiosus TaxID=1458 RepID=UPI003D2C7DE8